MDTTDDTNRKKKEKEVDEEVLDEEEGQGEDRKQDDQVTKLEEQLSEYEEKYRRALADYQNLEKRNVMDRAEWIKSANREMLIRILPIVDTLILAKKHDNNQTLAVTLSQFLDILKTEGVIKIETIGRKFDPTQMEVIDIEENGDTVTEEVRAGYLLYDKLLRPAQVKVGKK